MIERDRLAIGLVFLAVGVFSPVTEAQDGRTGSAPKADVSLVASTDTIVRGRPLDVGLHFKLASGWHIYWKNSGDSGLPPRVAWSLPAGFAAQDLQFPVPKRHVSPGDIVTNVLEGEPVLLARVTPPANLGGNEVTLRAAVTYLICNTTCLREQADVELTLPVRSGAGQAQPTHEALFRRARRALPKQSSKYLAITATTHPPRLEPGKKFELLLDVNIKRGFHIQSHEPLNPAFIKCDVFLERAAGLFFEDPIYPPPKIRRLKVVGNVSEYAGRIRITVPGEADAQAPPGKPSIAGLLKFQACNDKGTCFPPEALAFAVGPGGLGTASPGTVGNSRGGAAIAGAATAEAGEHEVIAQPRPAGASSTTLTERFEAWLESLGVSGLLAMCFLYGLLINATPCVLPLLSIKVLGFAQQAHESRSRTLGLGLAFGLGVMLFFVLLGLLARAGGNVLQYPVAVIALGAVVTVMALSMLGVFTLQVPRTATKLEASLQQEGIFASFGKGALAPVLGFACTAPMMGAGLAWATRQPPNMAVLAFVVMGLGMASPYVLLGANPNWLRFLPKPGNWMITFERIMGFLLLAMVVWLIHPLAAQLGTSALEWTLIFFVALAMACWILGKIDITMPTAQRWRYRGSAGAVALGAGVFVYGWALAAPADEVVWRPWSAEAVAETVRADNPVLVDFTAAYCTVCKVNKKFAVNTPEVAARIKALGFVLFQGDYTSGDEAIFDELQKHGRAGVPLNLIYRAGDPDNPIVLRPQLTKQYLLAKLDQAGAPRTALAATFTP